MKTKSKSLARHLSTANIPQSKPLNNRMIKNSTGGFVYGVESWDQLNRFLILGSTNGTYYVSERDLTKTNVDALKKCLDSDPQRYADIVASISMDGRAAKNDFAIFALAFACSHSESGRKAALAKLNDVCRIGTHLFQFLEDYKGLGGGFGRSVRTAVSNWYTSKNEKNLAQQLIKYRNRNSWTHRDVFRLTHTKDASINHIIRYAVKGWEGGVSYPDAINAFEMLKTADPAKAVEIINQYDVTREFVPTNLLADKNVMRALALKMPINAMIRNLGNMSRVLDWSAISKCEALERTISNLGNQDVIRKGRVHPMGVLTALRQYETGRGMSSTWNVHSKIVSGLNKAFKLSVKSVEPTNLRYLCAVDVSGSMAVPAGTNFKCSEAAAAMAWVLALTEPYVQNIAFSDKIDKPNVVLHENMSLSDASRAFGHGGGTDLALPVLHALKNKIVYDVIIIGTDNETFLGNRHLADAWKQYRKDINPSAKLVIASTASNQYTVGDPDDVSVLQCVGFDAHLLSVVQNWVKS
jgi:60 kDa SS-A/Ro ribonucleoprotein